MLIENFEELQAWRSSRKLTKEIYHLTSKGKFSRDFGLKNQIQRASVSILLNISEGFDSRSSKSFLLFLSYSFRSAAEVKSILYVALDLDYINNKEFREMTTQLENIKKMINGLIKHIKKRPQY